jgi:phosphoribosylamine---glycine ligase
MKVLVLGSGGREHALAVALSRDPGLVGVHVAPGNPGTAQIATNHRVDIMNADEVCRLATRLSVDLVVIGPEAPLVAGVADAVRWAGIPCFGASRDAARIEGSKAFAKEVMAAAGVPTGRSFVCETRGEVEAALAAFPPPYVVKDDGLAAGKGVVVTSDYSVAAAHAAACGRVLVEEFLDGPEVSLFAVTDGRVVLPLQPAQDFKRVGDDDTGPNTGGMGAYTPLPWAPDGLVEEVTRTVLQPTVDELARRGAPFVGLLYAGLALTEEGIRVIEFNARFGDPETQALLAMLKTPLGGLLFAAASGGLAHHPPLQWGDGAAVAVVLASEGYPVSPVTGAKIHGIDRLPTDGVQLIQAGTAVDPDGDLVSSGGRVLSVVGTGPDLLTARQRAYDAISQLSLAGSFYRSDIARAAAAAQGR